MKFCRGVGRKLKLSRHWKKICLLFLAALLLYHDPILLLWWPQRPAEDTKTGILPLDMATESIDDMYDGCRSEAAAVIDEFGVFEWHFNKNFSLAWASAELSAKKLAHKHLKRDHAISLYIYTKKRDIQEDFNRAVKTGKHKYSTNGFMFHYFYFYLTDAIQALRLNQSQSCRTVFYRTRTRFNRNVINTNMRFGTFSWAAPSKRPFNFNGAVSCFEIYSCFGADITYYSAIKQRGQVLIPPYEVFKINSVLTDDPWCSVVYKLQSTKIPRRDLNCKLNQKQLKIYFETALSHWQEVGFGRMLACVLLLVMVSLILVKQKQTYFVLVVLGALLVLMVFVVLFRVSH